MSTGQDDLSRVRSCLRDAETAAQSQRWDDERPWRRKTHTWVENGVVVVDMHDLSARVAKAAMRGIGEVAHSSGFEAHAITVVTGRGRHSSGGAVLPELVVRRFQDMARDREGWTVQMSGAGRVTLITDARRASASVTHPARAGLVILLVVFALGVWVCMGMPGVG